MKSGGKAENQGLAHTPSALLSQAVLCGSTRYARDSHLRLATVLVPSDLFMLLKILAFLCSCRRRESRNADATTAVEMGTLSVETPSNNGVSSSEGTTPTPEIYDVPDEALLDLDSTIPLPTRPFAALHLSAVRRHLNNEGRALA